MISMRQFEQGEKVKVRTNAADECFGELLSINPEEESATVKVLKVTSGSFFEVGTPRTVSTSSLSHLLTKDKLRFLAKAKLIEAADLLSSHESVEFMGNLEKEELAALKEKMLALIRQGFTKKS
jgi:hypothetical protein